MTLAWLNTCLRQIDSQIPTSAGCESWGRMRKATAWLQRLPKWSSTAPSARVTHFLLLSLPPSLSLYLSFSHPPLADPAAPNSSQRNICIYIFLNLIKKIPGWVLMSLQMFGPWVWRWGSLAGGGVGSRLIFPGENVIAETIKSQ